MTLSQLRYIVAVARERHFGRAAESCFVSQPTLSVAVKKLEEELGVLLFERGHSEVGLTPLGEKIVAQAQRVLEDAAAIKQVVHQGANQLRGPFRLGAIYTVGPYLIPPLIPLLAERAPEMPLVIEEDYTANLRQRLKQGDLDAIIISLPFEEAGVVTEPLYSEPFVVVLPAAHPLIRRDAVKVAQLKGENVLLLGAGHCFRDQVVEVCPECVQRANTIDGLRQIEGGSLETIRYMVASGMGITILPCSAAGVDRYSQRLLAIRRFADAKPARRVALAWRKTFPRPEAVELIANAIRDSGMTGVEPLAHEE